MTRIVSLLEMRTCIKKKESSRLKDDNALYIYNFDIGFNPSCAGGVCGIKIKADEIKIYTRNARSTEKMSSHSVAPGKKNVAWKTKFY